MAGGSAHQEGTEQDKELRHEVAKNGEAKRPPWRNIPKLASAAAAPEPSHLADCPWYPAALRGSRRE